MLRFSRLVTNSTIRRALWSKVGDEWTTSPEHNAVPRWHVFGVEIQNQNWPCGGLCVAWDIDIGYIVRTCRENRT
jgi:hypothetical protein